MRLLSVSAYREGKRGHEPAQGYVRCIHICGLLFFL